MFLQEMKKQWKRPEIVIAFIVICVVQLLVSIYYAPHSGKEEYGLAYQKYSGTMNEEWRNNIQTQMYSYMNNAEHLRSQEELLLILDQYGYSLDSPAANDPYFLLKDKYYTEEFQVLETATVFTGFDKMLQSHIEGVKHYLLTIDYAYDVSRVDDVYEKLTTQTDQLVFTGPPILNEIITMGFPILARCVLLFGILFSASLFNSELQRGTYDLLLVSRHGKQRLYWCLFAVNQVSMLLITLALLLIMTLVMTIFVGWNGWELFVQDFFVNVCPYPWNAGQFLSVMTGMTIVAGQVAAMVMFVIARYIRSLTIGVISGFVILLLPLFAANAYPAIVLLRVWVTTNLYSYHLWAGYSEYRFGKYYLTEWQISIGVMLFVAMVAIILIVFSQSKPIEEMPKKEEVPKVLYTEGLRNKYEVVSKRNMEQ